MNKIKRTDGAVVSVEEKFIKILIHIVFVIFSVICLYSFLIILGSSFQSQQEIMDIGYSVLPRKATLEAYRLVFENASMLLKAYGITILTTVIGTALGVFLTSTFAYVLSRPDYRYRKILSFYIFFTMLFNGGMVPNYIMITKWFGLKDNIFALILPLLVSGFYVLLMKGFFSEIPFSLIEAAKIDGANEPYIFYKIVMPISVPAFATIILFYVLQYWNDWWLSLMYMENSDMVKLQYMLIRILKNAEFLNSGEAMQMGMVGAATTTPTLNTRMAMCVLAAGPILVVFPFFQKYFVSGLTVGSVKG